MNSTTTGNFIFSETSIEGLIVVDQEIYEDSRGYFLETYKHSDFTRAGINSCFVQDNQSSSTKGVLRGLHFQIKHPQAKLVRVISGEVFDVAVDLRQKSSTFGKWVGVLLSGANRRQFYIPRGFAHGFLVLSETAEFVYKCDEVYHPNDEGGLRFDDPDVGIEWPTINFDIVISEKDKKNPFLQELKVLPNA